MPDTTTEILAAVIGLYFVVGGLRFLFDARSVRQLLWEFHSNGALTFVAGLLTFTIGATIVALHNDWSSWFATVVTIVGWAALVKGALLLLIPRVYVGGFANMGIPPVIVRAGGIVTLAAGVILLWGAFHGGSLDLGGVFR